MVQPLLYVWWAICTRSSEVLLLMIINRALSISITTNFASIIPRIAMFNRISIAITTNISICISIPIRKPTIPIIAIAIVPIRSIPIPIAISLDCWHRLIRLFVYRLWDLINRYGLRVCSRWVSASRWYLHYLMGGRARRSVDGCWGVGALKGNLKGWVFLWGSRDQHLRRWQRMRDCMGGGWLHRVRRGHWVLFC